MCEHTGRLVLIHHLTHSLAHPLPIALILYPNIILRISLRIAYASLMHSFDFIHTHHLMDSLMHR